jgi:hypothetical protein
MTANLVFAVVCSLIGLPFMLWILWQVLRTLGGVLAWLIEALHEATPDEGRDLHRRTLEAEGRIRRYSEATREAMIQAARNAEPLARPAWIEAPSNAGPVSRTRPRYGVVQPPAGPRPKGRSAG